MVADKNKASRKRGRENCGKKFGNGFCNFSDFRSLSRHIQMIPISVDVFLKSLNQVGLKFTDLTEIKFGKFSANLVNLAIGKFPWTVSIKSIN